PDKDALVVINQDLASYYCVLPISKIGNILTLAVGQPFDILKLDDLRLLTNSELRPLVGTERAIRRNLARAYSTDEWEGMPGTESSPEAAAQPGAPAPGIPAAESPEQALPDMPVVPEGSLADLEVKEQQQDVIDLSKAMQDSGTSPIIKIINTLVAQALRSGSSDIHLEAYEKQSIVRFREDGVLKDVASPPKAMHNALVSRIKVMSQLDVAERRIPQDGKFQVRFEGRQVDFRVSILPCVHGEKAVVRVLDSSKLNLGISQLGYEPSAETAFRRSLEASFGLVLLTGPTGSGKSTTLYASLREVLDPEENVCTIEDPVEYQLDGVVQTPVNAKAGLTFATALRSVLRQDPDIIMVGEIRDFETADIAVKAAVTGHLVLSTLHTNDAASAITRLTDMGVDAFMVSSSMVLVAAQRLCRRLCDNCKAPMDVLPPKDQMHHMGFLPEDTDKLDGLRKGVGCGGCSNGYRGRFAIIEALEVDDTIRKMIIQERPPAEIKDYAIKKGMLTLRRTGILNALRGKTTLEEVMRMTMGD
ncbi:MAG: type II/IV secretion system protein, partial [Planctomycetes bacterium]|nr:type II/IV secretion system protein [Planctomycetota bacterium]